MQAIRFFIVFLLITLTYTASAETKINGVSFVASKEKARFANVDPLIKLNANYAAIMPFGFIRDLASPEIRFNSEWQWYGETSSGAKQYINLLQKNGLNVMIKPQIWIWQGDFTGDLNMDSEERWQLFETTYQQFILTFAKLAEETNAELFCIGTELETFISQRPKFWKTLIQEVKKVYSGKLTYAANWDEYTHFPFWQQLDVIGVDAYFPITDSSTPTVAEARLGWRKWKTEMKSFSESKSRPILFTEFGYRSIDHAGREPWKSDRSNAPANTPAQANLTQALFKEFWNETWFAGGFVWKWFLDHENSGGQSDNRFTPQNKPAEDIIRHQYSSIER